MNLTYVNFSRLFAVLVLLQISMPPRAESKPVAGKKLKMGLGALGLLTVGHLTGRAVANREKKDKIEMSQHLPPNCRREVSIARDHEDLNKFTETVKIICDAPPSNQPQQNVSSQAGLFQEQQKLYPNLYVPQQQQQQHLQQQHAQPQQQQPQQHQLQHQLQQQQPQQQQSQHVEHSQQQQYPQLQPQPQPQLEQPQPQHPEWHYPSSHPQGQQQQSTGQQQHQQVQPQPSHYIPIYPQIPVVAQQPASQQYPSAQQQNQQPIGQQQPGQSNAQQPPPAPCANHSFVQQQPQNPAQIAPQTVEVAVTAHAPAPQTTERPKPFLSFIKHLQEGVAKRKAEQAAQQAPADGVKDLYLRIQQAVDQPHPPATEEQHKTPQISSEQVAPAAAAQAEPFVQPSVVVPVQPAVPSIQQVQQPAVVQQPNQQQPPALPGFQQPVQPIGFVVPPQQAVQPPAHPPQTVQVVQTPQQVQSPQPVQPVQTVQAPQPIQPVQVVQQPQPAQPAQGAPQVFVLSKKTRYFGKSSTDRILQTNLVLMMVMAFLLIWFQ